MELRCGIVGLPNVGKSLLFNAITKGNAPSENFPFCTIKPNQEMISVPDDRLEKLAKVVNTKKVIPTTLFMVDIAGLVQGASKGEGLGNQFLANIRDVDTIIHVLRCFEDENVTHVAGGVNPVFDLEVINQELQLADLATLNRKAEKLTKYVKAGKKEAIKEMELVKLFLETLQKGQDARRVALDASDEKIVNSWRLLTRKGVIYVANIAESALGTKKNIHLEDLQAVLKAEGEEAIPLCIAVEEEVARLSSRDQHEFLSMYGLRQQMLPMLVQRVYRMLDLITFFTAGPQEVRAWTVKRGAKAPQAAGVIHSDFEQHFIKAEVIKYQDYIEYGGEEPCKRAGLMQTEGKDYVVADGDVMHFRSGK